MPSQSVIEAMLLRWGESPTGRTVTFLLPEEPGGHPFKGLKCGPSYGQRLALSVVLIADDETEQPVSSPLKQQLKDSVELERKKSLAQQCGALCNDARFWKFLEEKYAERVPVLGAEHAASVVRCACQVDSRSEFDTGPNAAERWRKLHGEYLAWLQT